jgi:hypothetical protein
VRGYKMRMASFKITFLREKLFLANTHPKEIGPWTRAAFSICQV